MMLTQKADMMVVSASTVHAACVSTSTPLLRQQQQWQSCSNRISPQGMLLKHSSNCCHCHSRQRTATSTHARSNISPPLQLSLATSSSNGTSSSCWKGARRQYHITSTAARVTVQAGARDNAGQAAGSDGTDSSSSSSSSDTGGGGSSFGGSGGGGFSGGGDGSNSSSSSSSSSGDGGSPSGRPNFPAWYTVWMWATAAVYLVWRWRWRRGRRLAAEQFAKEQQLQEQADQEWHKFAQHYGVTAPQDKGS